jgi:hypothetical protein
VENAINASATLALLADLANLDKHRKLTNKPRSGAVPIIGSVSADGDSGSAGWHLRVPIRHGSHEIDGVAFATEIVGEWRAHLQKWGLI